jgi:hypothetical protein
MQIIKDKVPINIEFPANPEIKLDRTFKCPQCRENIVITTDDVMNLAGQIPQTAVILSDMSKLNKQYRDNPKSFSDYFAYRVPMVDLERKLSALGSTTTGSSTSIELPCGDRVSIDINAKLDFIEPPRKLEVLKTLGLNSEHAWRWLSWIHGEKVNIRDGKKRAERIQSYVDTYEREMTAYKKLKDYLQNVPSSETGIDIEFVVRDSLRKIEHLWDEVFSGIIDELEKDLPMAALTHGRTPKRQRLSSYVQTT